MEGILASFFNEGKHAKEDREGHCQTAGREGST